MGAAAEYTLTLSRDELGYLRSALLTDRMTAAERVADRLSDEDVTFWRSQGAYAETLRGRLTAALSDGG